MDIKLEKLDDESKREGETKNDDWFEVPIVPADTPNDLKDGFDPKNSNCNIIALEDKNEVPEHFSTVKCEFPENTEEFSYSMKEDEEKLTTKKIYSETNGAVSPIDKIQKKSFVCSSCFNINLKTNSPRDSPKCDQCGYKPTKPYPIIEKQSNSCAKVFKCEQCYFKSSNSSKFQRHKVSHGGETTFKCDLCSFKSSYMGIIEQHRQSHTERSFKCDLCEYTSTYPSYLDWHKIKHTGDLPFKCDQCNYQAIHLYLVEKHKVKYHTEYPNEVVMAKTATQRVQDFRARKRALRRTAVRLCRTNEN